ncbi:MAG: helix-turn-helix transcriptional regulator [Lachnospiraceae bacterium]|nr:helix-turn-helix transcriptional regulator [Lachnospiraceae bacterium]
MKNVAVFFGKRETGNRWRYLRQKRIEEAKRLLFISNWSISEIADYVGYENVSIFIRIFRIQKGISPERYRKAFRDSR